MRVLCGLVLLAAASVAQTSPRFGRGVWRGQDVEFRVLDGWAVFQGDIIIGRAAEMAARHRALLESPDETARGKLRHSIAVADSLRYWPRGVIPYEIDPGFQDTSNIDYAVKYWNENTAVRLVPRNGELNYVRFTRYSDPNVCASSALGMSGNGRQMIYGNETCPGPVMVHEIGHAAGLDHEQSRSDRDRYVTVLWENVSKFNREQFAAFTNEIDLGPYDYDSIMHYGVGDFGKGGPAMATVPPGIPIRQGQVLSPGDIDAVARIYGSPPSEVTLATTPAGLRLIVDGEEVATPRKFAWAPGSVHSVEAPERHEDEQGRYDFARWSDGGERAHTVTADASKTAVYSANYVRYNCFRFEVSPPGAGTVSVISDSSGGCHRDGTVIAIAAVPAQGFAFRNWSGPYVALNDLRNFSPNPWGTYAHAKYQGLVANFVPSAPSAAALPAGVTVRFNNVSESGAGVGGTVRVDGRVYSVPVAFGWEPGSTHGVEVDAEFPDAVDRKLVVFRKWNDGGSRVRQVTAGAEAASYAAIHAIRYELEAYGTSGGGLSVSPFPPDLLYDEGAEVELKATPTGAQSFLGWGQDISGTRNPKTLAMTETTTVYAFFGPRNATSPLGVMNAARQRVNTSIGSRGFATPAVSPGEVVAINAPDLAPDAEARAPEGEHAPTLLADMRVLIGGVAAPVLAVSKGQVTAVVPYRAAGSRLVTVALEHQGVATGAGALAVVPAFPSIYTADGSGSGLARALNEDGSANSAENPAARGTVLTLFATGLGVPEGEVQDGQAFAGPGPAPAGKLAMRIGSAEAEIVSAALAPGQPGVYRIEARVPAAPRAGRAAPLILTVDGAPSQFDIVISVR